MGGAEYALLLPILPSSATLFLTVTAILAFCGLLLLVLGALAAAVGLTLVASLAFIWGMSAVLLYVWWSRLKRWYILALLAFWWVMLLVFADIGRESMTARAVLFAGVCAAIVWVIVDEARKKGVAQSARGSPHQPEPGACEP